MTVCCAIEKELCKFFDSEIHPYQARFDLGNVPAQASITPTGQESEHSANGKQHQCEPENGHDEAHHMINVPCILPSMTAIAMADTNMPVMIHTMSII
jgi:hypothetical protein